jgi:hypothetical protein
VPSSSVRQWKFIAAERGSRPTCTAASTRRRHRACLGGARSPSSTLWGTPEPGLLTLVIHLRCCHRRRARLLPRPPPLLRAQTWPPVSRSGRRRREPLVSWGERSLGDRTRSLMSACKVREFHLLSQPLLMQGRARAGGLMSQPATGDSHECGSAISFAQARAPCVSLVGVELEAAEFHSLACRRALGVALILSAGCPPTIPV